jgi:hypothetical protein
MDLTFATDDGTNLRPTSRLRGLLDPFKRYAVPLCFLYPNVAISLYVQGVERAHLDVIVLLHNTSHDLQGRCRFYRRSSGRIASCGGCGDRGCESDTSHLEGQRRADAVRIGRASRRNVLYTAIRQSQDAQSKETCNAYRIAGARTLSPYF